MNYFLANNMAKSYTDIEGEMCQLVQLNPPTGASIQEPLYFDSNTMLDGDNCTITAIEVLPVQALSQSPNGQTPIDGGTVFPSGILTISDLKRQIIAQLPLTSLVTQNNNGKLKFTYFNTQVWQNCFIEFTLNNVTNIDNPILLNVYYVPKVKN
jgi:hypothetical protein